MLCELKVWNQLISESKQITHEFNNFFVTFVEDLANIFKQPSDTARFGNETTHSFKLQQTNRDEVLEMIDAFTTSHS